jgi:hypothetical protein
MEQAYFIYPQKISMQNFIHYAETILHEKIVEVSPPSASAGQNILIIAKTLANKKYVIRVSPPLSQWVNSGIFIRETMLKNGHRTPAHCGLIQLPTGEHLAIQSFIDGEDLECSWQNLSLSEAYAISDAVADFVQASITIFHDIKPAGLGRFSVPNGICAQSTAKDMYEFSNAWFNWAASRVKNNASVSDTEINEIKNQLHSLKHELLCAKICSFIWDTAERNVIICNGKLVGIVDQDELSHSDPLMAPALALFALESLGVPWAMDYTLRWVLRWDSTKHSSWRLVCLYAALYALQSYGKEGRVWPDGRLEKAMDKGIIFKILKYSNLYPG